MKSIRSLLLMLLGGAALVFSLTQPAPVQSQTDDPIKAIRDQYAKINKNAAKYKSVKKGLSGFSAEGGELVAYFDGEKIMKMVAKYFGEGGRAVEEYYYKDDRLIFVYRKDSIYDGHMSGKVARTEETRYYFNDDRMVRWIDEKSKQVAPGTNEYLEKEKDYIKLSKELTGGARSQKSTIESAQ